MVIFTKKENDPVDIMQKLSRLIHQQEERIARLIEMETSDPNPKLSLQIDRAMRVLDTLLQHYRNMACDLGLMTQVPKVMPVYYTYPTPAQAKFQDQMMRGMQEQERAKAEAARAAEAAAIRREGFDSIVQDYAARGIVLEFPFNAPLEEQEDFFHEAFERLVEMNRNGLSH